MYLVPYRCKIKLKKSAYVTWCSIMFQSRDPWCSLISSEWSHFPSRYVTRTGFNSALCRCLLVPDMHFAKEKERKLNQRRLIWHSCADDLRHGTQRAACQQVQTQPLSPFQASGSKCGICGSSTSQDLFISYIPCEVAGGTRGSWNLNSPSFTLPDQNTRRKPHRLSHICRQIFGVGFVFLFFFSAARLLSVSQSEE